MNGRPIARLSRANEEWILEGPAVDEELGSTAGGLRVAWTLDVAADTKGTSGIPDRDQGAREVAAPDSRQPLDLILLRGNRQPGGPIHLQLEAGFRMRQGQSRDGLVRGARLAGGGA